MNAINSRGYQDVPMTRRRAQLLAEYADKLADMLEAAPDDKDLAEWVQSKIDRAAGAIQSAYHYLDQEDDDELEKARTKKYDYRRPSKRVNKRTGRREWDYFYAKKHGAKVSEGAFVEGAAFRLTWKGRKGHFHIHHVSGDQVFISHDSRPDMEPVAISKSELRALLKKQHGKAEQEHLDKKRRDVERIKSKGVKRGLGLALHRLRQAAQVAGVQLDERYQRKPKKKKPAQVTDTPREDRFDTMPEVEESETSFQEAFDKLNKIYNELPPPKGRRAKDTRVADALKQLSDEEFKVVDEYLEEQRQISSPTIDPKTRLFVSTNQKPDPVINSTIGQAGGSFLRERQRRQDPDRRSHEAVTVTEVNDLFEIGYTADGETIVTPRERLEESVYRNTLAAMGRLNVIAAWNPTLSAFSTRNRREADRLMQKIRDLIEATQPTPRNELTETAQQIIEEANQEHEERHDEHQEITRFELGEHTHTKTGAKLYTAKQKERTDRDEYFRRVEIAKKHGGRYESRYVRGFVFKSAEDARAFALEVEGAAQEAPETSAETVTPHEDHPSADNFETMPEVESAGTPKTLLDDIRSEITVERFIREGRRREDTAEREVKKLLDDLEKLEQGLLNREYSTEAKQAKAQEILNRRLPKILEQMRRLVSAKLVIPQLSGGAGQRNAARYHRAAGDIGIAEDRANKEYQRALKELDRLEERQPQAAPREQLTETAPETRLNVKQVRAREAIKRARGAQTRIKTSNRADKLTSTGRRARASINEDKQLIEAIERIIDQDYRDMERPLPSDINQRTSQQDNFAKLRGALNGLKSSQTLTRGSWTDDQESLKKKRIKSRSEIEDALKDLETRFLEELQTQIQVNIEDLPPKGQRTAEDAKRFFGEPSKNEATKRVTYERDGHIVTGPASGRGEGKFRYDLSLPRERFRDEPLLSGSLSSNEIGTYDTLDEALTAAINQYEPSDQIIDRMIERAKEDRERTAQRMAATPREQLTETAREVTQGADNFETMPEVEARDLKAYRRVRGLTRKAEKLDRATGRRTNESKKADQSLAQAARSLLETEFADLPSAQEISRKRQTSLTPEEARKAAITGALNKLERNQTASGAGSAAQAYENRSEARAILEREMRDRLETAAPLPTPRDRGPQIEEPPRATIYDDVPLAKPRPEPRAQTVDKYTAAIYSERLDTKPALKYRDALSAIERYQDGVTSTAVDRELLEETAGDLSPFIHRLLAEHRPASLGIKGDDARYQRYKDYADYAGFTIPSQMELKAPGRSESEIIKKISLHLLSRVILTERSTRGDLAKELARGFAQYDEATRGRQPTTPREQLTETVRELSDQPARTAALRSTPRASEATLTGSGELSRADRANLIDRARFITSGSEEATKTGRRSRGQKAKDQELLLIYNRLHSDASARLGPLAPRFADYSQFVKLQGGDLPERAQTRADFRAGIMSSIEELRNATTAQPTSSTQKSANHLIDYRAQLLQTIERIA